MSVTCLFVVVLYSVSMDGVSAFVIRMGSAVSVTSSATADCTLSLLVIISSDCVIGSSVFGVVVTDGVSTPPITSTFCLVDSVDTKLELSVD